MIETITENSFYEKVLDLSIPVIVEFTDEGSGMSHLIERMMARVKEETKGNIEVRRMLTKHNKVICDIFQIANIPTLLIFNQGKIVERIEGILPERKLRTKIENLIVNIKDLERY